MKHQVIFSVLILKKEHLIVIFTREWLMVNIHEAYKNNSPFSRRQGMSLLLIDVA